MKALLSLCFILMGPAASFFVSNSFASGEPQVHLVEIRGSINPASASYFVNAIKKAEAAGAQALLLEMDTPGGLVTSTRTMAQAIDESSIPVIVYITPAGASATSAGALIALASHYAVMAPGSNIGAAHPVGQQGKDMDGAMKEKAVNDVAAFARSLAELRGRNVKIAEKVVTESKSYTANEALKSGIIDMIVDDREELLTALDRKKVKIGDKEIQLDLLDAEIVGVQMTKGEYVLHLLANPSVAAILMSLAMLLIYLELSNPGITIAGIFGAICLLIALMSFQLLPIRTGGILLLVLGVALIVAELFVAASGALAAGGVISFLLGVLWFIDPNQTDLRVGMEVFIPLSIGFGGMVFLIGYAAARTNRMARDALAGMGGGKFEGLSGYTGKVEIVEPGGKTGKILIRGEVWDFSSSENVQVGDEVVATGANKMHVQVKKK